MSEYQYYEFLALDQPLSQKQIAEVRRFSTRAEITPTSFVNEYHFGDFHGSPELLVSRYFDVMVYYANWGTNRLLMNLPTSEKTLKPYASEVLAVSRKNDRVLLDFESNTEDFDYCEEGGSDLMASLAPIRAEIAGGDTRPLFLGWIADLYLESDESDAIVPPIPDGMRKLSSAQKKLAEFIRVNEDLLEAAANHSNPAPPPAIGLSDWIANLPKDEKNRFIENLISESKPSAIAEIRRRYQLESRQANFSETPRKITVAELLQEAKVLQKEREFAQNVRKKRAESRRAAEAAEERERRIRNMLRDETGAWKSVENIVANKQDSAYATAVNTLTDLREVAVRRGALDQFVNRVRKMRHEHRNKSKFLRTLDSAKLIEK